MIARNVEARLTKLEGQGKRTEQFLAVWRKPGGDVDAALTDAKFSSTDRVVCFEWFGSDPVPAPKWHRNMRPEFSEIEELYVFRAMELLSSKQASVKSPSNDNSRLDKLTDGELLHRLWGVGV